MGKDRPTRRLCLLPVALLLVALAPSVARAETRTFLNTTQLFPSGGALTEGPANVYPSRILVSGLSGTVTKATVTLIGFGSASPDDVDMVITGPNGRKVMLMSDACGINPSSFQDANLTFDDSAPTFLSNPGPCQSFQTGSFKPSNYEAPELDDLSQGGGPAPPYGNALSAFNGASPNGAWNLFVFDDNSSFNGFGIPGWALTLTIQPPLAVPEPENDFTIGNADKNKNRGTADLTVEVPGPGDLELGGEGLKPASASAPDAGEVQLPVKPAGKAKKKLKKKGKAKVNAEVTFTPDGGDPNTESKKVKLAKK